MEPAFTADAALAICRHMNDDHADAIAAYARAFGGVPQVASARMTALDAHGMDLGIDTGGAHVATRVAFDHELQDADDARETLIALARRAMA